MHLIEMTTCLRQMFRLLFAGSVIAVSPASMGQTLTHGPILGAVSDEGIKVWARSDIPADYELRYSLSSGGSEFSGGAATLGPESDFTGVVSLAGLRASTDYDYRILLDGDEQFAGTFTTLPPTGGPSTLTFAYGADFRPTFQPFNAFDQVILREPDFMILGGDNIYADLDGSVRTKSGYEAKYKENWSDAKFRAAQQQVPMFMMWDDHEIIDNWDQGSSGLRYQIARAAFDEYQGSTNPDPIVPNELYYSYSAGEVDFFVLDTRSHRDRNFERDDGSKSMLGATQRAELLNWLDTASGKFKFVVSSVPFNEWSTTGRDSWYQGFRSERDLIFDHIRDNEIGGVVLLSGDQHWSGVFQLNSDDDAFPLLEFQPTPAAIGNRGEPSANDPRILYKSDAYQGVGVFTVDTTLETATLNYQWIDVNGRQRFGLQLDEAGNVLSMPEPEPAPEFGLIAHYEFEDGPGSLTAVDSSGNGHTGTLVSGASIVDDPQRGNVYAYQNGSGSHLDIDLSAAIPSLPAEGGLTLAAWIKRDDISVGDFTGVLVLGHSGDHPVVMMTVNNDGSVGGYVEGDGADRQVKLTGPSNAVSNGVWTHIALTVDRANDVAKMYVDGIQSGTDIDISSVGDGLLNWGRADVGALGPNYSATTQTFPGWIDDARIYYEVLREDAIYDLAVPVPEPASVCLIAFALVGGICLARRT